MAKGTTGKKSDNALDGGDTKTYPRPDESGPRQDGRRLKLTFRGVGQPELHKIEFCYDGKSKFSCWERYVTANFQWSQVPQALCLLFLDYIYHDLQKRRDPFEFEGKFAKSLHNARYQNTGIVPGLFSQLPLVGGGVVPCAENVLATNKLRVEIKSDFLPPDCIEVFRREVDQTNHYRLAEAAQIKTLKDAIRLSLGEPIKPELQAEAESPLETPPKNNIGSASENAEPPKEKPTEKVQPIRDEERIKESKAVKGTARTKRGKLKLPLVGATDLPVLIDKRLPSENQRIQALTEAIKRQYDILPNEKLAQLRSGPQIAPFVNAQLELRRMCDQITKAKGICSSEARSVSDTLLGGDLWAMNDIFADRSLPSRTKKKIAEAFLNDDELIRELAGKVALADLSHARDWLAHCAAFFPSYATENIFWHLMSRAYIQPAMPRVGNDVYAQWDLPKLEILPLILRLLNSVPTRRRAQAVSVVASFYLRDDARELQWIAEHKGRYAVLEFVGLMRQADLPITGWPDWLMTFK